MYLYLQCLNAHKKSHKINAFGLSEYEMMMITTKYKLEDIRRGRCTTKARGCCKQFFIVVIR
jgi:hypothetical protein